MHSTIVRRCKMKKCLFKVCDHCFRQGELHKCKGKCGGSFHMKCLSDVGRQPVTTGSLGRKSKPPGSHQKSKVRQECEPRLLRSRRKGQCEIVTVKPRYVVDLPNRESLPGNFHSLSLTDQIDYSMQVRGLNCGQCCQHWKRDNPNPKPRRKYSQSLAALIVVTVHILLHYPLVSSVLH